VAEEFGVPAEVKVVQVKTASYCVKPIFPLYLLLCLLCPYFDNPNATSALLVPFQLSTPKWWGWGNDSS